MRKVLTTILALIAATSAIAGESLSSIAKSDCQEAKPGVLACDFGDPLPVAKVQTLAENARVIHVAAAARPKVDLVLAAIPAARHGQTAVKGVAKVYRLVVELTPTGVAALKPGGVGSFMSSGVSRVTSLVKAEPKASLADKLRPAIDSQCKAFEGDARKTKACRTAVQLRMCEVERAWGRDQYCPAQFETSTNSSVVAGRTCDDAPLSRAWVACADRVKNGGPALTSALDPNAGESVDARIERRFTAECNTDGFFGVVGQGACREKVRIAECMGHWAENPAPGESRCQQKPQTLSTN